MRLVPYPNLTDRGIVGGNAAVCASNSWGDANNAAGAFLLTHAGMAELAYAAALKAAGR